MEVILLLSLCSLINKIKTVKSVSPEESFRKVLVLLSYIMFLVLTVLQPSDLLVTPVVYQNKPLLSVVTNNGSNDI